MKNPAYIFFIFILCLASSCRPVVYSTIGQNVPLFRDKGEVSLVAGLSATEDGGGMGFQFAGAVDSSLAIITSFYFLGNGENVSSDDWQGKGNYFEIGGGKFGGFSRSLHYEAFLGCGFGGIRNSKASSDIHVRFIKPFIQPSIGVSAGEWFDFAFTPRVALASYTYHSVQTNDQFIQQEADNYFRDRKSTVVFEPGVTLRFGYRSLKAQIQYCGTSFTEKDQTYLEVNSNYFSLGLQWMIARKFLKK